MAALLAADRQRAESPMTEIVTLPSGPAKVAWRRNARARRVSMRIDAADGSVVVTLPPRAGRTAGMALLTSHADWVAKQLAGLPPEIALRDGALIPIGGEPHAIRHRPDMRGAAWLDGTTLNVTGDRAFLARRVLDFLRAEAARRMAALARAKAAAAGLIPGRITVKDTMSRWGSCAPDGALAFSWRLVMAPLFAQDYVAAHEVAHLRYMNHGPAFWALVECLTPHKAAAVAWLRAEGPALLRIR